MNDLTYQSPLATRNASAEMQEIWSPRRKFTTWRKLWLALAEAQHELGLPVSQAQIEDLKAHQDDIDYDAAAAYEKKLRHDVMAHVHALGDVAQKARPIIHLGATSQFVNCNTELILIRDGLKLVAQKLATAICQLGDFAKAYRSLPTLGFTHFQPAQPTTVGKRATLWAMDLALALEDVEHRLNTLRFRGVKGTTGTQASFLALFEQDGMNRSDAIAKVNELDQKVTKAMGWEVDMRFNVTGQTYPRLVDGQVVAALAGAAAACSKMATDIRLLANKEEIDEPRVKDQVGSSAMPYKRNPMRCERICGLSRFVMGLSSTNYTMAGEQWMERTLDDSSCRRLTLPEPFLALDGVLDIVVNVTNGLVVYENKIHKNLFEKLPFMATENLMMAAVKNGHDRQDMHDLIKKHSIEVATQIKMEGKDNDLLERLGGEEAFAGVNLDEVMDPALYVGAAPEQVDCFNEEVVEPIRHRYADVMKSDVQLKV